MSPATRLDPARDGSAVAELDLDALAGLDVAGEIPPSPWQLASPPDWSRVEAVRLLSARFVDGTTVALAAVRRPGSKGHDEDAVRVKVIGPDGEATEALETLLSAEQDAQGEVRRIGLEVWMSDEPPPHRLAADRLSGEATSADGTRREAVAMTARLDGKQGTALLETLRPAS